MKTCHAVERVMPLQSKIDRLVENAVHRIVYRELNRALSLRIREAIDASLSSYDVSCAMNSVDAAISNAIKSLV